MTQDSRDTDRAEAAATPAAERRLMGSLRDALVAAASPQRGPATPPPLPVAESKSVSSPKAAAPASRTEAQHIELDAPQTRVVRPPVPRMPPRETTGRTLLLRGRQSVKRTDFHQDPVVAWLVVVGGLGLGAFRPVFEGNNTIGRAKDQRIPIDFGDETISSEEQAYIRYDSVDRKFLLVPNLAKTNIVAVNDRKPTGAVELAAMDLITMGRTQLVFVPFCGHEFDWADLQDAKS